MVFALRVSLSCFTGLPIGFIQVVSVRLGDNFVSVAADDPGNVASWNGNCSAEDVSIALQSRRLQSEPTSSARLLTGAAEFVLLLPQDATPSAAPAVVESLAGLSSTLASPSGETADTLLAAFEPLIRFFAGLDASYAEAVSSGLALNGWAVGSPSINLLLVHTPAQANDSTNVTVVVALSVSLGCLSVVAVLSFLRTWRREMRRTPAPPAEAPQNPKGSTMVWTDNPFSQPPLSGGATRTEARRPTTQIMYTVHVPTFLRDGSRIHVRATQGTGSALYALQTTPIQAHLKDTSRTGGKPSGFYPVLVRKS